MEHYHAVPVVSEPAADPPRKARRGWITLGVILVVIALLAVVWLIFGDRIRHALMSDRAIYEEAERRLLDGDASLQGKMLHNLGTLRDKAGRAVVGIRVPDDPDMEPQLKALNHLEMEINVSLRPHGDRPQFALTGGLRNVNNEDPALTFKLYQVGADAVLEMPQLFDHPLKMKPDVFSSYLDPASSHGSLPLDEGEKTEKDEDDESSLVPDGALFPFLLATDVPERAPKYALDAFLSHAPDPDVMSETALSLDDLSERVTAYRVTLDPEAWKAVQLDFLRALRADEDLMRQIADLAPANRAEAHASLANELDRAIEELEAAPADAGVERTLYLRDDYSVAGEELKVIKDGQPVARFALNTVRNDADGCSELTVYDEAGETTLTYTSRYTVKGKMATGHFRLSVDESDAVTGTFERAGLKKIGGVYYLVGSVEATGADGDTVRYTGKAKGGRHVATFEPGALSDEASGLTLVVTSDTYPANRVDVSEVVPADAVDLSDQTVAEAWFNGGDVMIRLLAVMSSLGLSFID